MATDLGKRHNTIISQSPVASLLSPPKTDDEIISFVEDVWSYNRRARSGFDFAVKEAIHFIGGDQWIQYLPYEHRFVSHALDDWVPTPTTNLIGRTFDRLMDILLEGDPFPTAAPATDDQTDIESALSMSRVLESEARRLKTQVDCYAPCAAWLITAGSMAMSAVWNGRSGDRVRMAKMGLKKTAVEEDMGVCQSCDAEFALENAQERCPVCNGVVTVQKTQTTDSLGRPQFSTSKEQKRDGDGNLVFDEVQLGQIDERAVNMLNFYPHRASTWRGVRHVVEVEAMDVEEIKDIFGSKAKDVVAESMDVDSWDSIVAPNFEIYDNSEREKERDMAILKWMRHVPNKMWPKGKLILIANGHILHDSHLDSIDGNLPYRFERWRAVPNTFWGMSPLKDLIPIQKRINAIDSHLVTNRKKMVSNQWLVPQGSGVSTIDGRAGLVIRYDPMSAGGHKPQAIPGIPVSPQVVQERETAMRDYQEVSGEVEVLLGRIPPGVESGYQVDLLVEQALKRFGPIFKRFRTALADHEHRKGIIAQAKWPEARLVTILGENMETETFHYSGADLRNAVDMVVSITSELEASPALKRTRVQNALQAGLLGDPRRPEVRGKILEKLGIEGFDVEYVSDAKKARRVIRAAQDALQMPPIFPGVDNAAIQLQIFREYMLSAEFEKADQGIQQALFERVQELTQMQQQEQARALAAAQGVKGTGDQVSDLVAQSGALGDSAVQPSTVS